MSRRAIKSINWAAFGDLLHESDKPAFNAFKSKSDQYLRKMQAYPEAAPKLDWVFYKQHVPVAGLVDKFQKEYESMNVPYPADNYSANIDTMAEQSKSEIQQFISQSKQQIEEHNKNIAKFEAMIPYEQMTMEDFKDAHPDIAIDPVNRPTVWPHRAEFQPDSKDEESTKEHGH